MQPLHKRLTQLQAAFDAAYQQIQVSAKLDQLATMETQLAQPELWHDPVKATRLNKEFAKLKATVDPWVTLRTQLADIGELMELGDASLIAEFDGQLTAMEAALATMKQELRFNGPYDGHDAIIRLTAGVGGTDAQDFTEMLERMYIRWIEKAGCSVRQVERSTGDEAGIKTSVLEVSGPYAYGRLKSENGVHRLVRLSPFNSDNLRQTSFALVEVLPAIDAPDEVILHDKDLKIDVYRSGGHGGQSVNTTDSAVRVTHLPTGIKVAIQNERSQLQNKETALKILRSKLAAVQLEQHAETVADLRSGESAAWGSQIRNYVLHPYTMVKDTRTKYEEHDAQAVLDGKIDGFIEAYLATTMS